MRIFEIRLKSKQKLSIGEPTVRECDGIINPNNTEELTSAAKSYLSRNNEGIKISAEIQMSDIIALQILLTSWLRDIKVEEIYQAPPVQSTAQEENAVPYKCTTTHIKAVADYAVMSFTEVYKLPITEFWKLFHDAVIWNYSRTEEGRDRLREAKAMSSTEPDREALGNSSIVRSRRNGK